MATPRTNSFASLLMKKKKQEKEAKKPISEEERKLKTRHYCTFFRRNINVYATKRLGVNLHFFQQVMLYLMNKSMIFVAIMGRGIGKTFITALFAVCKCMLYPNMKVVITSSTISQATVLVKEKIEKELCKDMSPVLKYLYDEGQIKFSYAQESIGIDFLFNGSSISVLGLQDSSRGRRGNLIIYEEFRLLKKSLLDSIFEGMLEPRRALFLNKPEYRGRPELLEDGASIYISSSGWKTDWLYPLLKSTVNDCYNDKNIPNNFFAGDVYTAVSYGMKTQRDLDKQKSKMSETTFRIELLNEILGSASDAYFSLESFKKNSILTKAFRPPTLREFNDKINLKNRKKAPNEKRLLFIDYAFSSSMAGSHANDNTILGCMSMIYRNGKIERNVEYLETHSGGESDETILRIRELFFDYEADYIVMDIRNGGEVHFNTLSKEYEHPYRTSDWNSKYGKGFTIYPSEELHVVSSTKLDDLRARTVDKNAMPVIIPIVGTSELNGNMWVETQKRLRDGDLRFLIDEIESKNNFEEDKNYLLMESDEKARIMLPFIQTDLLIDEAINLTPSYNNGFVKLSEARTGTKDRIVALSYGNYIATLLENKLNKEQGSSSFDIDKYKFLAG